MAASVTAMDDRPVEIPEPLADCFKYCETFCVAECCGINAFDPQEVPRWAEQADIDAPERALTQVRDLIAAFADPAATVSSNFLNHRTASPRGREEIAVFLERFRTNLNHAATSGDPDSAT